MPLTAPFFNWTFVDVLASRALLATDASKWLNVNNAAAVNITLPDPADVAFKQGTQITLEQIGAGAFTLVAGVNVTINSRGGLLVSNGASAVVSITLKSIGATAVWTAFGDLA